jgi:hypothetical protein
MKTLEIKKTESGQYKYQVVDLVSGTILVPAQWGVYGAEETIAGARERFHFDSVVDITKSHTQ